MAAVLAEGDTVINNVAREPEIVDLCNMLVQMGAESRGSVPTPHRPRRGAAHPTEHRVIGDRIVAATWGIAAVMTRGDVRVNGVDPEHLGLVLDKLQDAGATVTERADGFRVSSRNARTP